MIKLEFTGTLTAINVIAFKNKKGEDGKRNEYLFKVTDNNYDSKLGLDKKLARNEQIAFEM